MALRFNPAPGWPAPPEGWEPPDDWGPDPAWPAAPEGWTFWVEEADEPTAPPTETAPTFYWSNATLPGAPSAPPPPQPGDQKPTPTQQPTEQAPWEQPGPWNQAPAAGFQRSQWVALIAALAVPLGSVLPFVSYEDPSLLRSWEVRPGVLAVSFLFGVVLTGLVVLTRQPRLRPAACISLLALSLPGFCCYLVFTVVGLTVGIDSPGFFGEPNVVHWSPGIGVVLCILGTAVTAFQSVLVLRIRESR